MNKDIESLKERIIMWIDERDKLYVIPLLSDLENAIHEHSFDSGYETGYDKGLNMTKYKLYTFSGVMYVVPVDKYKYIDDIAESYFEDYCAGLFTSQELDRFVEECIIGNGGDYFYIWYDYYVFMNKE